MPPETMAALSRRVTLLVAAGAAFGTVPAVHAADATAASASATGIVRPAHDEVVRTGKAKLVLAAKGGRVTKVDVDGVDVTPQLRRGPKGAYTARLSLGRGLHYGINHVFVRRSGGAPRARFQHSRFIVAKRDDSLLELTALQRRTGVAPVRVALRRALGTSVLAYVNGRRVEHAFKQEGRLLVGRLGANDGLRFGRNWIRVLVHKTHPHKRQSSYQESTSTIRLGRDMPLASAGRDRRLTANSFTRLDARASKFPTGSAGRSFKWEIVSAPRGSKAKLRRKATRRPALTPDRPGRYRLRVTVRGGKGKAVRSTDTVLLTALSDLPPIGVPLQTMTRDRGMVLNGTRIPKTECCHNNLNYAVIDRAKPEVVVTSGYVDTAADSLKAFGKVLDGYTGSQDYLVALNWVDFSANGGVEAVRNEFDNVLQKIGAQKLTDRQRQLISQRQAPGSAIGVAGAPAGSAYVTLPYRQLAEDECTSGPCDEWVKIANQSGALRLNGAVGKYDFVYTDFVDFDTEVNQTPTQLSPPNLTIKVGDRSFTRPNPGRDDSAPGVGGFHLLRLNAKTLEAYADFDYRTNTGPGTENVGEVQRLANDLAWSADQADRPLVILQAYGYPHGKNAAWDQAARAVERLGGTRQVFLAMNATDPRPENGERADRRGPYALVGRTGMSAPRAEASYSLNGLPGRIGGVLMRSRDGGFEPMLASAALPDGQTTVNTELIRLSNQAPTSFPAFKDANGQPVPAAAAQAAQRFLGGPEVTKLCSAAAPVCDIRKLYHQSFRADWASIQDDLNDAKTGKCPGSHQGFNADQCEGIRKQLRDEVSMVSKVTRYLGPEGLQQPFGAASVAALADLGQISQEIKDAINPPPGDNAASSVLSAMSVFVKIGGFAPPPGSAIAAGLSGVFAVAAYYTHPDGSPNLVGPKLTTTASKLGVDLAARYQQAGDNLDDIGRILVSDYGKLSTLASKVSAAPGPGERDWRLDSVGKVRDGLQRAAKQTIYERLVPLAFPVMYDLGESGNARAWYCDGGATYDKRLFNEQPDGAQFSGRFQAGSWNPTIAVAQAHAIGKLHGARIPGVPGSVADILFKDPSSGGIGLNKLEFYSPNNGFRFFPSDPSPRSVKDSYNNWNTMNQFPQGRPGVIACNYVPDPPGNSG